MKKILIVDNSSWNIYNFRKPLVKALAKLNHDVTVLTPIDSYIHYLNETEYINHKACNQLRPRSINPFRDILLLIELLIIYKKKNPDLIIHYTIKPNIFGNIAARVLRIPSISVITGLGFTYIHPKGINRIIPWLYKIAFKRIKKIIFYNPDDKGIFIKKCIVPENKCILIPGSGVNTTHFLPTRKKVKNKRLTFLFIGRLLKDKGLVEFIEASKKINEIENRSDIWVVGDFLDTNPAAVPKETFLQWVENKDIYYWGKLMDVRQVLQEADVLVLPSYREGIPRVILEAMAMGKPIITTDAAGCRETVIHGQNGFIVPVRNAEALFLAMNTMIDMNAEELQQMGINSRKRVLTHFDETIIVDAYLQLLSDLFPNEQFANKLSTQKVTSS